MKRHKKLKMSFYMEKRKNYLIKGNSLGVKRNNALALVRALFLNKWMGKYFPRFDFTILTIFKEGNQKT